MYLKIYQINSERDKNRVTYAALKNLESYQGSASVDPSLYDKVYEGEVDCKNFNEIYMLFSQGFSSECPAHSLSMSDVVEICGGAPELVGKIRYYTSPEAFHDVDYIDIDKFNEHLKEAQELHMVVEAALLVDQHIPTVENGFYYCDRAGFVKIDFEPNQKEKSSLNILITDAETEKQEHKNTAKDKLECPSIDI